MQEVFAITLASMQQDMSRMDRVAMNLANVATPGYRREVLAARPFANVLHAAGAVPPGNAATRVTDGRLGGALAATQVLTDTRLGSVRVTGQPLDVALTGEGFFEVTTPNGPAYTRQGNFSVDARGRLVTAQGLPVAGWSGDIYLTTRTPAIDEAGKMTEPNATSGPSATAPGTPVAQLKVVRFEKPEALERLGDGLVAPGPGMTMLANGEAGIRQGAVENANVSSAQEMVQLVQTMRHFESMLRIAQGYDEMLGTAIRKLGDLT